jgi:hypothetical protein
MNDVREVECAVGGSTVSTIYCVHALGVHSMTHHRRWKHSTSVLQNRFRGDVPRVRTGAGVVRRCGINVVVGHTRAIPRA